MAEDLIRLLVVEDDLLVAEQMRFDLEDLGYLIIDIVDNAKSAIHLANISRPDIILLDIRIKGELDGISTALEIFSIEPIPIIFITSLSDKDTFERAKKAHPFAYLLKPANKINLKHTIELAIENFNDKTLERKLNFEQFPFLKQNLLIKEGNKLNKISIEDIYIVEVEEKYCSIYTETNKYIVRISLKDLLFKLPKQNFFRIHRNYVVNMNKVNAIDLEHNTVQTEIKNLPLGRKYRSDIIKGHGYIS